MTFHLMFFIVKVKYLQSHSTNILFQDYQDFLHKEVHRQYYLDSYRVILKN